MMPGHFLDDEAQVVRVVSQYYQQDYWQTLWNYTIGEWGYSWAYPDQSVISFIQQAFTFTIGFQLVTLLLVVLFSVAVSYLMIVSQTFRFLAENILYLGTTLPLLFLLPVMIFFFSFYNNFLPIRYDGSWLSYLLPLLGLAFRPLCFSCQILFQKWSETIRQDYFRTALSKGLSFSQCLWRHGFKNSALTYVTQVVQFMGQILTGSVLVETLFSLPGLGFLFVESLRNRDLPILMGLVFVFCCLYLVTQILLDWAHHFFEPRSQL